MISGLSKIFNRDFLRGSSLLLAVLIFVLAVSLNFFHTHSILEHDDHCPVFLLALILSSSVAFLLILLLFIEEINAHYIKRYLFCVACSKYLNISPRSPPRPSLFTG